MDFYRFDVGLVEANREPPYTQPRKYLKMCESQFLGGSWEGDRSPSTDSVFLGGRFSLRDTNRRLLPEPFRLLAMLMKVNPTTVVEIIDSTAADRWDLILSQAPFSRSHSHSCTEAAASAAFPPPSHHLHQGHFDVQHAEGSQDRPVGFDPPLPPELQPPHLLLWMASCEAMGRGSIRCRGFFYLFIFMSVIS